MTTIALTYACPTPWKRRYTHRADAKRDGKQARRRCYPHLYPYRCPCGMWHNTHRPRNRGGAT